MQEAENAYYWLRMSEHGKKLIDKRKAMARSSSKVGVYSGTSITRPPIGQVLLAAIMRWPKYNVNLIESFRSPFTLNGNGEKRHKVSRYTLNRQSFPWIFNISYVQNHLLLYEISVEFFCSPADSIQRFVSVHL